MHHHLCQAINEHELIFLRYNDGRLRIIEPHAYWSSPTGKPLLRAFQRSGFSVSQQPRGWKTFRVDQILSAQPAGQTFRAPRAGYDPFSSSIGRIYAMIPVEPPSFLRAPAF